MRRAGEQLCAGTLVRARPAAALRRAVAEAAAGAVLRPRHTLLAAFVAGLLAGPRWPAVVGALVFLAAVLALLAGRRGGAAPLLCAAAAAAILLGAVVADARIAALDRSAIAPAERAAVRGWLEEAPRARAFGARVAAVTLRTGAGVRERVLVRAPSRVRWPDGQAGEEVVAHGRLRTLLAHEGFERRRGIHAVLDAERIAATGVRRRGLLDRARRRAERGVAAGLPAEQAALARGMVLGQDHALPGDLREALRAAGLGHLVAASGQNVMLLAALVLGAAALLGLRLHARLGLALVAVALYVPLAGAGPSIQRAGVMGAAGLVAALAGRASSRWYALLLAAAATLAFNPRAAEEPGWQLSFAAVLAILLVHRRLVVALRARGAPRALAEAAALTIAATAGTAPLLALHFGELSLVSLPANLLAVPAVAPIMWLGAIAALLGGAAARACNALAAVPLAYLAWLGRTAAALPHATVAFALPSAAAAGAAYAAMAGAAVAMARLRAAGRPRPAPDAPAGVRRRRRWPLLVGVAALGVAVASGSPEPPAGLAVSFLDVGQGDATLVQHGRRAVLVDTGPPGAPVLEELRAAGVRRLDALFVTHRSADHDGNAAEVLANVPVGLLLDGSGRIAAPPGVRRVDPRAGEVLEVGPLRLEFLWPPPDAARDAADPNLTATVALVTAGPHTVLLPADAESPVTAPLDLPDVDVLKVAHHGSEDAGLPALLRTLRPEVAVVPVGRNAYGHPAPATMAALRAVPLVRRNDRDGTVRVVDRGGRLVVE